jgi:NAD-dependent SIR2 family protein deacetylase
MPAIVRNDLRVEQQLRELAARLRDARRVTVMTGAGVSAASGVPTLHPRRRRRGAAEA